MPGSAGNQSRKQARRLEPVIADIASLSHDGRGVVSGEGKTVFVHGALPGETVSYVRVKKRRNYDEGRVLEVLSPSPKRVTPRCEYFGVCGGCSLQHLDVAEQIRAKQDTLLDNLTRIGGVTPETLLPAIRGPAWAYRRRARLGVKNVVRKERVLVGFRERLKPYVTDMSRCEILAEPVGSLIDSLAALIDGLSIRNRLPQIEVAVADNAVALVLRVLDPPTPDDLNILRDYAARHEVIFYLQPGGLETVAPLDPPVTELYYELGDFDVRIEFAPTDFLQVNGPVNEAMVAQVVDLLEPGVADTVLDLFSGLGNFALPLARAAGHVVAVEGDTGLVARARRNASINDVHNVEFHVANLFEPVWHSAWADRSYDKLLIDPPRAGAMEVVAHARRFGVNRIVYVSCHPGSLARDAGHLVKEHGYRLCSAGVMDMFPHTSHVESIAMFESS